MAKKKDDKEIQLPMADNGGHVHGPDCHHDHDVEATVEEVLEFMQERCEDILVNIRELQEAMDDLAEMVEDDISPVSDYAAQLKQDFKRLSFLVDAMLYGPEAEEESSN